jgi:hypothetical protein
MYGLVHEVVRQLAGLKRQMEGLAVGTEDAEESDPNRLGH